MYVEENEHGVPIFYRPFQWSPARRTLLIRYKNAPQIYILSMWERKLSQTGQFTEPQIQHHWRSMQHTPYYYLRISHYHHQRQHTLPAGVCGKRKLIGHIRRVNRLTGALTLNLHRFLLGQHKYNAGHLSAFRPQDVRLLLPMQPRHSFRPEKPAAMLKHPRDTH